jgi:hypothetical protein
MSNTEIKYLLESKGLSLQGGTIIRPTRSVEKHPSLLEKEQTIIKSIHEHGIGGTALDTSGVQLLLSLGVGSLCIIQDQKRYIAYGMVHPDSSIEKGRLVLAQIGKYGENGFWTPENLNPSRSESLNLSELLSTFSALSQLATVGHHDSPKFAGVADPRHLFSAMSTSATGTKAWQLLRQANDEEKIHIADEWEKTRSLASIVSKDSPVTTAVIPIPVTIRSPISEIEADASTKIFFPRYLVDDKELVRHRLVPIAATEVGALELMQAMAYHQVLTQHAGDTLSRLIDGHR